jgi:Fe-S-cluster containining protein
VVNGIKFDCWGCGACCRAISCTFLDGNRCRIYAKRPDICRVGYSFDPEVMTAEQYLNLTRDVCKQLEELYPPKATVVDCKS